MDNNLMDDYVLVLEDRTEVKNEAEVGKLSVVSNINEKGKLKIAPAEEANQSDFLKFNSRDGLLKNFMRTSSAKEGSSDIWSEHSTTGNPFSTVHRLPTSAPTRTRSARVRCFSFFAFTSSLFDCK